MPPVEADAAGCTFVPTTLVSIRPFSFASSVLLMLIGLPADSTPSPGANVVPAGRRLDDMVSTCRRWLALHRDSPRAAFHPRASARRGQPGLCTALEDGELLVDLRNHLAHARLGKCLLADKMIALEVSDPLVQDPGVAVGLLIFSGIGKDGRFLPVPVLAGQQTKYIRRKRPHADP